MGVSTAAALLAAADPAGRAGCSCRPAPRTGSWSATARRDSCPDRTTTALPPDEDLIAVDLAGRAPEAALARGGDALERLPATLLRLGAARLAAGETDDLARLVPEYVTLPRGVRVESGTAEVAWSRTRP